MLGSLAQLLRLPDGYSRVATFFQNVGRPTKNDLKLPDAVSILRSYWQFRSSQPRRWKAPATIREPRAKAHVSNTKSLGRSERDINIIIPMVVRQGSCLEKENYLEKKYAFRKSLVQATTRKQLAGIRSFHGTASSLENCLTQLLPTETS